MLRDMIMEAIRRGRGQVRVRDLVHHAQDDRRREADTWARRADPTGLGMFSQGRRLLVRAAGPARLKPHVVEHEVREELRLMVRQGTIRILCSGKPFDPERAQIPWDAVVLPPLRLDKSEPSAAREVEAD